jgi:hypothetical protein
MSGQRPAEVLCGLLAGVWGLLLLGAYLQPYGDSRYPEPISLHPALTPIEYPYLIAFGIPQEHPPKQEPQPPGLFTHTTNGIFIRLACL